MKALAVIPRKPNTAEVIEIPKPEPKAGQVLVKMLEVGVCGTDSEINQGLYGESPAGEKRLVLGHEGLGQLEDGTLVTPMVRRPCPDCSNCRAGFQDMCSSGEFSERGIKGIHGMISEYIVEDPRYLIRLPPTARSYGVLMEPMSVVAKGMRQAVLIQRRLEWRPKRALVLGAGPIGLLAVFTLKALGWEVAMVSRRMPGGPKSALVEAAGGVYVSTQQKSLEYMAKEGQTFDLVFEATGSSEIAFDAMPLTAINGVLCWTSITGGTRIKSVPADKINIDFVLGNKVLFGTVNASSQDFEDGLAYLQTIEEKFPGLLQRMFTENVTFDKAQQIFETRQEGIKTVFRISGI